MNRDTGAVIRYLVANGASINLRDDAGFTPLGYAIAHPNKSRTAVELLLQLGATE